MKINRKHLQFYMSSICRLLCAINAKWKMMTIATRRRKYNYYGAKRFEGINNFTLAFVNGFMCACAIAFGTLRNFVLLIEIFVILKAPRRSYTLFNV